MQKGAVLGKILESCWDHLARWEQEAARDRQM